MSPVFFSSNFSALVFGREILKKKPQAVLSLQVQSPVPEDISFTESDFWTLGLQNILQTQTRFGRIGILFDRKNQEAKNYFSTTDYQNFPYHPQEKRRAETSAKFTIFQTQIIHEMANEGLSDTVEFRRLARKYIRKAKNHHLDTLFFPEAIFGEEKTRKILQHLAGTQLKVYCPTDFLWEHSEIFSQIQEKPKRELCIFTGDEPGFTHQRAEKILRSKISVDDIKPIQ